MVDVNIVRAANGSLAAGRDMTIIVNIGNDNPHVGEVFKVAGDKLQVASLAESPNRNNLSTDQIANGMMMVARVGMVDRTETYGKYFQDTDMLRGTIESAGFDFRNCKFESAHKLYGAALEKAPDAILGQLTYDYVVSGYVAFSLTSNLEGLRRLLERTGAEFFPYLDARLKIVVAEAHQEIATRQANASMLAENQRLLDELAAEIGDDDPSLLNLRGLQQKRMGERNEHTPAERLRYLQGAAAIFDRLDRISNGNMGPERRNNWAISLIRVFELTEQAEFLERADDILDTIDFAATTLPLNDYLALPKARNNRGNIRKQKLRRTRDVFWYASALEEYAATEKYWNEPETPYEWAMVQKNKADVRCEFMDVSGFNRNTAELALSEIDMSLRHRTEASAPYQYARSVGVRQRLARMLEV